MLIPEIEQASPPKIKAYQEDKLKELLLYLSENSPFYKDLFAKHNIQLSNIKYLEDLQQIPPTTKHDLQTRNKDFICVSSDKIIDYITTSGTLAQPITFALSNKDLDRLAYNEFLSFACAGGQRSDIYQLMVTLDKRFMAGMAYFLGLRKLGAGLVRVGAGNPALQFETINRITPTQLVVVPSFLVHLAKYAEAHKVDLQNTSIKGAVCIGEPIRNPDFSLNILGRKIKETWNIDLYSTYASTEMSTAFTECQAQQGGHHHPELIIVEFLNEDNEPVKEGEEGELTITTLGVETMPLLRFKTGDICAYHTQKCSCGRTSMRLGPVIGRKQQMIKFKGTTLYPPSIYEVLNGLDMIDGYIIEFSTNEMGLDDILVKMATSKKSEQLVDHIKDQFRTKLRVVPNLKFCSSTEINALKFPKLSRKPVTLIDKRIN